MFTKQRNIDGHNSNNNFFIGTDSQCALKLEGNFGTIGSITKEDGKFYYESLFDKDND